MPAHPWESGGAVVTGSTGLGPDSDDFDGQGARARRRAQHETRHTHTPPQPPGETLRPLRWALYGTVGLFAVKLALAVWGGSLAVAGDALHSLADVGAYGVAYAALRVSDRPPTDQRTYGLERSTVLAAILNGLLLLLLGLGLAGGAAVSWVAGRGNLSVGTMALDGILGLIGTTVTAGLLLRDGIFHGGHGPVDSHAADPGRDRPGHDLAPSGPDANSRAAALHAVADAGSSLAVLVAAGVAAIWHWPFASAACAIGIGLGIVVSSVGLVRETLEMLLEAVPRNVRIPEVLHALETVPGIRGVHHVHIWSVGAGQRALSGHVTVQADSLHDGEAIVDEAQHLLEDRFGIGHSTLQMESGAPPDDEGTGDTGR